jgi:hypothetical protein
MKLQYPTYVKKYLDAHIKVFKKAIKVNGETVEVIVNLFGFTRKDSIFEWGKKLCSRPSKLHF